MGSCRKATGESGNEKERGQGDVERKELRRAPTKRGGAGGLEGRDHAARGVDGWSCPTAPCSTEQESMEGELRRHRLQPSSGEWDLTSNLVCLTKTRLSAAGRRGLQSLPAVWQRPHCPHPFLTPLGLQMLVLNPWDQRPQTAATV